RRAPCRASPRTPGSPGRRTRSSSGSTCSAGRASARRRAGTRGSGGPRSAAARGGPLLRLADALEQRREALAEHGAAVLLDELEEARPRDDDDVHALEPPRDLGELLAQHALHAVALHGATDLSRDRQSEPRRVTRRRIRTAEGVDDHHAVRHRASTPVHGVEVAGAADAGPAGPWGCAPGLHVARLRVYAERRARPLARRRFRMARPPRVLIRLRNPWVFFRLRLFGF